ncbi:MAG: DNA mismatch repair protein MutS [Eubacteriales bacterium]|nr:DNA mismatch repair protein MutS [Eubacteriales bacterium]
MADVTPMMRSYLETKKQYEDCLVFYRLGDFYELFFDDAVIASRELELVLTGRDCGLAERAQMCGIPHHAVDTYVARLIQMGYKVAIVEQLTDPREGPCERGVIRVITPGTVIEPNMLEEKANNYIMAVTTGARRTGLAWCDVSTGEFFVKEIQKGRETLKAEIETVSPIEIVAAQGEMLRLGGIDNGILEQKTTKYRDSAFEYKRAECELLEHFGVNDLSVFDLTEQKTAICAAGALIAYLHETQKNRLTHINRIRIAHTDGVLILDSAARRNLELTETIRTGSKRGSLLWLLDKTETAMGGRRLRLMVEQPLNGVRAINKRLDAIQAFLADRESATRVRAALSGIYDIERLCSKLSYGTANARDCLSLMQSLQRVPELKAAAAGMDASLLKELAADMDEMADVRDLIEQAIDPDAPVSVKEGNLIRRGFNAQLDELRDTSYNAKAYIAALETEEREKTGIKNLKIGFNKVFGYYFEVTKSYYELVPYYFTRKQTLTNCERFITQELKELEEKILGADEKSVELEYKIFCGLRDTVTAAVPRVQKLAAAVAYTDALGSLALAAEENRYVRPEMTNDGRIDIINGRHPVVELTARENGAFIPNDTHMDTDANRIMIITGPNMAGKSTYMRQVAVITLMAHIGSFVPATSASIGVCDRIFTRVGASDDLSAGQSTFMVEMNEVANILNNATSRSLVILDEIGRGTSTYDGLSIAWAVVEYLREKKLIGAKTLFSTHYHELTEMEKEDNGIRNYSISVKEVGDDVIFLRKIVRGGTDKSFGIYVAKLAGLPKPVIERAGELLVDLEKKNLEREASAVYQTDPFGPREHAVQMGMLGVNENDIIRRLNELNVNQLTPMEAMNELFELCELAKELKK